MQNSSEAVTNASETREAPPRDTRAWIESPSSPRRRSIPIHSPSRPPSNTAPKTISGLVSRHSSALSTPSTSVTSPSPSITRSCIAAGSRCPSRRPIAVPSRIAPTLMNVPVTPRRSRVAEHGAVRPRVRIAPDGDRLLRSVDEHAVGAAAGGVLDADPEQPAGPEAGRVGRVDVAPDLARGVGVDEGDGRVADVTRPVGHAHARLAAGEARREQADRARRQHPRPRRAPPPPTRSGQSRAPRGSQAETWTTAGARRLASPRAAAPATAP